MPENSSKLFTRLVGLPAGLLVAMVRLYQSLISPILPALFGPACGCRFYPTCSQYATEALRTPGALTGSWLALKRLVKCTPLHPGGLDPVPAKGPTCTRISPPSSTHQFLSHG